MKRRLFSALTVLSLVLFLAMVGLCLRTRFVQDLITFTRGGTLYRVHAKENGVVVARIVGWPSRVGLSWESAPTGAAGLGVPVLFSVLRHSSLFGDIDLEQGTGAVFVPTIDSAPVTVRATIVVVPWSWFVLTAVVPAAVLTSIALRRIHVRRSRRSRGLCIVCGYDLRATNDRCPECGTTPASA